MNVPTVETDGVNTLFLGNYFGLIKSLTREQKIQLAEKITQEIAKTTDEHINDMDLVDKFCGAWKPVKDADKIITEIRTSRNFNRTIEKHFYRLSSIAIENWIVR
jgi:hypothetical protein